MVGFADGVDEGDSEGGIVCPGKRVGLLEGMAVGWFEGKSERNALQIEGCERANYCSESTLVHKY